VQGRRLGESVEEHFVGVGMFEGIFEITPARLGERAGAAEGSEEFDARLDAHSAENTVAVAIALVKSRSGGAGSPGDAPHGESFFSAPVPQAAGGVEDALFELRVWLSGQRAASALPGSWKVQYFDHV
jgi:hypothetical protein